MPHIWQCSLHVWQCSLHIWQCSIFGNAPDLAGLLSVVGVLFLIALFLPFDKARQHASNPPKAAHGSTDRTLKAARLHGLDPNARAR
eukprot:1188301-Prymnesium_polylepis.1